ncbi:MAG TPA: hypothetical protein VE287_10830, partial [Actinopolymorphaceae bacterium]|nr:hypothetical protein [Actinopolymorphaceae bacterium]
DPVAAAVAVPWHVLRSVLVTALSLPIAVLGAGILVGIVVLFFYAGAISPRMDIVCAATALVIASLGWWGIEGEGVQRGSQRIFGAVLTRRWVTVAAWSVLAVVALLLVTVASTEPVSWWPLPGIPVSRLNWPG